MPTNDPLASFARQYRASLEMLRQAIAQCPDSLWTDSAYPNQFWHVAYHTLFYTHLYLYPAQADFRPWSRQRTNYQFLGPLPWPPHDRPAIDTPYTRDEILEYHQLCLDDLLTLLPATRLDAPSGFPWLPFTKFELQIYNIRHAQHHAAQLIDRLRTSGNGGVPWVSAV